ncbi:hypothetical protein V8B97DRAFT_2011448 [Scleroderma yunnanense]
MLTIINFDLEDKLTPLNPPARTPTASHSLSLLLTLQDDLHSTLLDSVNLTGLTAVFYKSTGLVKPHTPSWDNCSAFWMLLYPKSPALHLHHLWVLLEGKGILVEMKAKFNEHLSGLNESAMDQQYKMALLKHEQKPTKLQVYMCDKEIAYLEVENEKDHQEAEKIHCCQMEQKQLEVSVLKEEEEVLCLKVKLAKLQVALCSASGTSSHPPSSATSGDHP